MSCYGTYTSDYLPEFIDSIISPKGGFALYTSNVTKQESLYGITPRNISYNDRAGILLVMNPNVEDSPSVFVSLEDLLHYSYSEILQKVKRYFEPFFTNSINLSVKHYPEFPLLLSDENVGVISSWYEKSSLKRDDNLFFSDLRAACEYAKSKYCVKRSKPIYSIVSILGHDSVQYIEIQLGNGKRLYINNDIRGWLSYLKPSRTSNFRYFQDNSVIPYNFDRVSGNIVVHRSTGKNSVKAAIIYRAMTRKYKKKAS